MLPATARSLISLLICYPPIFYLTLFLIAQDDGTDIEFRNVGFYTPDGGEIPKRTQTTYTHFVVLTLRDIPDCVVLLLVV